MKKSKPDSRGKRKNNPKNEPATIYGLHAVRAALANEARQVLDIWANDNAMAEIKPFLRPIHPPVERVSASELTHMLGASAVHQGVAIAVKPLKTPDFTDVLSDGGLVLALDQINDPRNLGAIVRSAAAFGARAVVVPRHNSPQGAASLAKAASGALEIVPLVEVANLARACAEAKDAGFFVLGLDEEGATPLTKAPKNQSVLCVMGAEGKGLRRLTRERCDALYHLPLTNSIGDFTTLNVSAATAIALYILSK